MRVELFVLNVNTVLDGGRSIYQMFVDKKNINRIAGDDDNLPCCSIKAN